MDLSKFTYNDNKNLFYDYKVCSEFLKTTDFKQGEESSIFHCYTDLLTDKEEWVVKSFLATHDYTKHKFILWHDNRISPEMIKKYEKYVDIKYFDFDAEKKNTPVEHISEERIKDSKYYLKSDLMRLLVLHNYGGIFTDMDIFYLRDFSPLIGFDFMYQWGSETQFDVQGACATVIGGNKHSNFFKTMLSEISQIAPVKDTTIWGKDLFAKVWRKKPFLIFPSFFFNAEWMINVKYKPYGDTLLTGWFEKNEHSEVLFLESFAWHWHNSSNKNRIIQKGSKFDLLRDFINTKLVEKNILI
jgi:hypothetical protein